MCNCKTDFEKVWERIGKNFQIKNDILRHRRVTKELREAKRRLQVAQESGLRGARKRWAGYRDPNSDPNGKPIAKESKGKVNKGKENKDKKYYGGVFSNNNNQQSISEMYKQLVAEGRLEDD